MSTLKAIIGWMVRLLAVLLVVFAYYLGKQQREFEVVCNILDMGEPDLLSPVLGRSPGYFD